MLTKLPPVRIYESEPEEVILPDKSEKYAVKITNNDGVYFVEGEWLLKVMKSVNFDKTNPILFDIICDLEGNEWCSWPKFAFHVYSSITDRNTDEGLRTLFDLFIDDPNKETITFDTFKRICNEVGENMSDEEMKNILEITTQNGNEINFEDFCQYMKLTA